MVDSSFDPKNSTREPAWPKRLFWGTAIVASGIVLWKFGMMLYWFRETGALSHTPKLVREAELAAARTKAMPSLPAVGGDIWEVEIYNIDQGELKQGIRITEGKIEAVEVLSQRFFFGADSEKSMVRVLIQSQGKPPSRFNFTFGVNPMVGFLRKSDDKTARFAVHEKLRDEIPLLKGAQRTERLTFAEEFSDSFQSDTQWNWSRTITPYILSRRQADGKFKSWTSILKP